MAVGVGLLEVLGVGVREEGEGVDVGSEVGSIVGIAVGEGGGEAGGADGVYEGVGIPIVQSFEISQAKTAGIKARVAKTSIASSRTTYSLISKTHIWQKLNYHKPVGGP